MDRHFIGLSSFEAGWLELVSKQSVGAQGHHFIFL